MHMIFCENIMGPIINQHHLIYSLKWGVKNMQKSFSLSFCTRFKK